MNKNNKRIRKYYRNTETNNSFKIHKANKNKMHKHKYKNKNIFYV